jgi:uncharacterized membrane protein YcaP (DUF421 family)
MELELYEVLARAVCIYIFGVLLLRVSKKRLLKGMSALDIMVTVILGSLLSRGINGNASIVSTIISSSAVLICHWLLSLLSSRSHYWGYILKGEPKLLLKDGELNEAIALDEHLSKHDIDAELRRSGAKYVSEVREAWLERNGTITVIRK